MLHSRRLPSSPWEGNTEERTLYHDQYNQAANTNERFCLIPNYYKTAPLRPDNAEISPAMQDFTPGIEPHQMLPLSPLPSSAYHTQDGRATTFGQSHKSVQEDQMSRQPLFSSIMATNHQPSSHALAKVRPATVSRP